MASKKEILSELTRRASKGELSDKQQNIIKELKARGYFNGGGQKQLKESLTPEALLKSSPVPQMLGRGPLEPQDLVNQLPLIGTLAGGVAGAPASLVGGPLIGAGIGAAGGKALQNIINNLTGTGPQLTAQESYLSPIQEGTTTTAFNLGTAGLGKAGTALAGTPAGQAVKNLAKETGLKIAGSTLGTSVKEGIKTFRSGADSLGQQLAKRGVWGFKKNVHKLATENLSDLGGQLDDLLIEMEKKGSKVDPVKVMSSLDDVAKTLDRTQQSGAIKQINKMKADFLAKHAKTGGITLTEANEIKKGFGKMANWAVASGTPESAMKTYAKFVSRGLRKQIETLAPGSKELNKNLAFWIDVEKSLAQDLGKAIARGSAPVSFSTATAAGTGAVMGGPVLAATGAVAQKASKIFPVRTALASLLVSAGKPGSGETLQLFLKQPQLRKVLFNALGSQELIKATEGR